MYTSLGYTISGKRLEEMQKNQLNIKTVRSRMRDGWSIWEAVSTPVKKRNRLVTREQYATARKNGISSSAVKSRVYQNGWNVEKAITTPMNPQGKKFTKTQWEMR